MRAVLSVVPMAGGISTPALVVAAGKAGALGFLAAGYRTAAAVARDLTAVRAAGCEFGLNIFVPTAPVANPAELDRYRAELADEAAHFGVDLPPLRLADDDHYSEKVELAVRAAPPVVSFTFGIPELAVIRELQAQGSTVCRRKAPLC